MAGDSYSVEMFARCHRQMLRLVPLAGDADLPEGMDPTVATAAALALIFGWRFFNPCIVASLRSAGDASTDQLHAAMHRLLGLAERRLVLRFG